MCTPEDCEKCDGSSCNIAGLGKPNEGCPFKKPDGSWRVQPETVLATVLFPPVREASEVEIAVSRVRYKDGQTALFGTCEICKQFPCPHVTEQGYWVTDHVWKLNSRQELQIIKRALGKELNYLKSQQRSFLVRRRRATVTFLLGEADKLLEGWRE